MRITIESDEIADIVISHVRSKVGLKIESDAVELDVELKDGSRAPLSEVAQGLSFNVP